MGDTMKRFLLFSGEWDLPGGGWRDFTGSYDDMEDAIHVGEQRRTLGICDWWHVVDTSTGKMIRGT